jgi:hypothetical protein
MNDEKRTWPGDLPPGHLFMHFRMTRPEWSLPYNRRLEERPLGFKIHGHRGLDGRSDLNHAARSAAYSWAAHAAISLSLRSSGSPTRYATRRTWSATFSASLFATWSTSAFVYERQVSPSRWATSLAAGYVPRRLDRGSRLLRRHFLKRVLVNFAVLHDDFEVLVRVGDQFQVRDRIPVDE